MQVAVAGSIATTSLRGGDVAWLARHATHRQLSLGIRIWDKDGGGMVGWTFFQTNGSFILFVASGHGDPTLIDEMLDVIEDTGRAAVAAGDHLPSIHTYGIDPARSAEDRALAAALEGRGFEPDPSSTGGLLRRSLDSLPPPVVPAGYRLGPVDSPAQVLGRVEAHRAAFAPAALTLEKYERVRKTWPYRSELDRIATTDDGLVVAFCTAWIDEQNATGLLEPVGTHPDHQRRGLASAVCLDALQALRDAGARTAEVAFATEAALATYRSIGFALTSRDTDVFKSVDQLR